MTKIQKFDDWWKKPGKVFYHASTKSKRK